MLRAISVRIILKVRLKIYGDFVPIRDNESCSLIHNKCQALAMGWQGKTRVITINNYHLLKAH